MALIDPEAGAALLSPASLGNPMLGNPGGGPQLPGQPQGVGPLAGPGQGAAPQAPEAESSGAPYGASILSSLQAKGSPFVKNLAKYTEDTAKAAPPGAMSQPGTWAKSLVGGALSALGGAASSLGDVAHATDNYKPGQGKIQALANVVNARNQRQSQQAEQQSKLETEKALRAETFARTLQLNKMISRQDEQDRIAAYDRTSKNFNEQRDTHETKDNLTTKDLDEMAKPYITKDDPTGMTGFSNAWHIGETREDPIIGADGKPVIDPKTGKPQVQQIFTAQSYKAMPGLNENIPVTAEDHEDFKKLGLDIPADTKMDSTRLVSLRKQAGALFQSEAGLVRDKETALGTEQKDQVYGLLRNDPQLQGYASQGYFGLERGQHVTEARINGVPADKDEKGNIIHPAQPGLLQQIADMQAKNPNDPNLKPLQDDLKKMQELDANIDKVREATFTPEEISKIEEKREADMETARQRAETERHNREEEALKAQEIKMKQLDEKRDIVGAATLLRTANEDPAQLSKRAKNYQATLDEADRQEMAETGHHYNIAQASTDFKYANQKSTQDTMNMINGITERNGSLDIAVSQAKKLPRVNEATVNKLFTLGQEEFQDPRLSNFHTSMLGLADEYSKVMGGGQGTDASRQQALDLLKAGYTKNQTDQAAAIIRRDIAARKTALINTGHHTNRYLANQYGVPEPTGYTHSAVVPGAKGQPDVTIYAYPDGVIMDAEGNKYDNNGKRL